MGQQQPTKTASKPGLNNPGDMSQGDLGSQGARRGAKGAGGKADVLATPRDREEEEKTGELGGGQRSSADDSDITNVGGSSSGRRGERGRARTQGRHSD